MIATFRSGDDYTNEVGVDGRWQKDVHTLTGQWIHTATDDPAFRGLPETSFDGDAYSFEYGYSTREWSNFLYRTQYDDGFRADMGFIGQVGYVQDLGGLTRHWWDDAEALFNHITVNGRWYSNRTNDGDLLDLNRDAWVGLNGPMQSYIEVSHLWRDKAWNGQRFDESLDRMRINFEALRGVNIQFFVRHGDRVDLANTQLGEVTTTNPYVSLNIGRSLIVSVNHNYERLSRDGGDVYVANLVDLPAAYQFNLRQRLRLAVARNDLQRDPSLTSTRC